MALQYIYLVADELTRSSIDRALRTIRLSSAKILLVESAWKGYWNRWKYRIAAYPDYPERNNDKLKKLVERAKDLGIPTVFEIRRIRFDRFIDSAKLFDHVFTVDETCTSRYRAVKDG